MHPDVADRKYEGMDQQMNPGMDRPRDRSINFHNPGTADHVAGEIRDNWNELLMKRDDMQMKFNEATNEYEVCLRDLNHRIAMAEAAINTYESLQPQQAEPSIPSMGQPNATRR